MIASKYTYGSLGLYKKYLSKHFTTNREILSRDDYVIFCSSLFSKSALWSTHLTTMQKCQLNREGNAVLSFYYIFHYILVIYVVCRRKLVKEIGVCVSLEGVRKKRNSIHFFNHYSSDCLMAHICFCFTCSKEDMRYIKYMICSIRYINL